MRKSQESGSFFCAGSASLVEKLCMSHYNFNREIWKMWEDHAVFLRNYIPSDCETMAELFFWTVHTVNAKDYTKEQLDVWATGQTDGEKWNRSFLEHDTAVAIEDGKIVGFGDMDQTGYLDRLYVHKDYQHQGIASAICDRLEGQ